MLSFVLLSLIALANPVSMSFNTVEGYQLNVKRKNNHAMHMNLIAEDKSNNIVCSEYFESKSSAIVATGPLWLSSKIKTAGELSKNSEMHTVNLVSFGEIPKTLRDKWISEPTTCIYGISVEKDYVVITFANLNKQAGRKFTLDSNSAIELSEFVKSGKSRL